MVNGYPPKVIFYGLLFPAINRYSYYIVSKVHNVVRVSNSSMVYQKWTQPDGFYLWEQEMKKESVNEVH